MKQVQLFLMTLGCEDPQPMASLEAALGQQSPLFMLHRLIIEPEALDGSDESVERIIEKIRSVCAAPHGLSEKQSQEGEEALDEPQAIVIGYGLAGSLALWMNMLDKVRPRRFSTRNFSVDLIDAPLERGPALLGTVALSPLLGLDFSADRSGPVNRQTISEWLYSLAGTPVIGGLMGRFKADFSCYGYPQLAPQDWSTVRQCLPFASVVRFLPSLKRPAVIIFDQPLSEDSLAIRLGSLNSRLSVMVCDSAIEHRVQAILHAVDRIDKGSHGGTS